MTTNRERRLAEALRFFEAVMRQQKCWNATCEVMRDEALVSEDAPEVPGALTAEPDCCRTGVHIPPPPSAPPAEPERIVAAAIEIGPVVYTGPHHASIIHYVAACTKMTPVKGSQGFMTSRGRCVSRKLALEIAVAAGQVDPALCSDLGLMSENLWLVPEPPTPSPACGHGIIPDHTCGECGIGLGVPSPASPPLPKDQRGGCIKHSGLHLWTAECVSFYAFPEPEGEAPPAPSGEVLTGDQIITDYETEIVWRMPHRYRLAKRIDSALSSLRSELDFAERRITVATVRGNDFEAGLEAERQRAESLSRQLAHQAAVHHQDLCDMQAQKDMLERELGIPIGVPAVSLPATPAESEASSLRQERDRAQADYLPIKYGRDHHAKITIAELIDKFLAAVPNGTDAFCDVVDAEFIFGCYGETLKDERYLNKDLRGLLWGLCQRVEKGWEKADHKAAELHGALREVERLQRRVNFMEKIDTSEGSGWCGEHPRRFAVNAGEDKEGTYDECQVCRAEKAEKERDHFINKAAFLMRLLGKKTSKAEEQTSHPMAVFCARHDEHEARYTQGRPLLDDSCSLCFLEKYVREATQYLHTPGCPHGEMIVANCCEGNDAALNGLENWAKLREATGRIDKLTQRVAELTAERDDRDQLRTALGLGKTDCRQCGRPYRLHLPNGLECPSYFESNTIYTPKTEGEL